MHDELVLLLVVVALYLGECLLWIPRNCGAFFHWTGRWRLRFAGAILGNPNGALAMANPCPPLGIAARSEPLPCSLSPAGILSFNSAALSSSGRKPQRTLFLRWEEINSIELDGKKLFLNGSLFLKAISSSRASELAGLIKKIKSCPEAKRPDEIRDQIIESLSAQRVGERLAAFRKRIRFLQTAGNVLFVFLFLAAPLLTWRFGFIRIFWWILALMLAQTVTISVVFWRAHKALYPNGGDERLTPFLTMLLAPPSAIRAIDFLARNLFESFHPLAVAETTLPKEEAARLRRQVARDLEFPLLPLPSAAEAAQCEAWFRGELREGMIRGFPEIKNDFVAIKTSPSRVEPENDLFCPRCLQQFMKSAERCIDCGGRELLPLV